MHPVLPFFISLFPRSKTKTDYKLMIEERENWVYPILEISIRSYLPADSGYRLGYLNYQFKVFIMWLGDSASLLSSATLYQMSQTRAAQQFYFNWIFSIWGKTWKLHVKLCCNAGFQVGSFKFQSTWRFWDVHCVHWISGFQEKWLFVKRATFYS